MVEFSYQQAIELDTEYRQLEESKNTEELIQFYEKYNTEWRQMIDAANERYSMKIVYQCWRNVDAF